MSVAEMNISALHGGDIISASEQFGIALDQWIDLSTGLNPDAYPSANVPDFVFRQLPYLQPDFLAASASYYGSGNFIPLIGSQMLIQNLPHCVDKHPVLLPEVGYCEHRKSWLNASFELRSYPAFDLAKAIKAIDTAISEQPQQHLVVINPNNPSGLLIDAEQLLRWAGKLASGCYLIVDEAFIDVEPGQSVLAHDWPANVLVLRSFGKFFGLAGIRIGFAFCTGQLRQRIQRQLGLWMINGPAQYLAGKAMSDKVWQDTARVQIERAATVTQQLFLPLIKRIQSIIPAAGETGGLAQSEPLCAANWQVHQSLFSSYKMPMPIGLQVQQHFARSGILLRVIELPVAGAVDTECLLRIGILPTDNSSFQKRVLDCINSCSLKVGSALQ
ncbi:MAG: aminotransferase class I/II-fold pyridoxal phosphate-dependent enzyme [Pseudomonadales bacterium]|nr:aminotransferase class I/II-fold pyridoxal phosphate-dependent enzyme [Pseudomonadales bacterium]NRA14034.1 aminotransferase class I/II-fold pyridoxal phosphate-dependent enzyme [Oceanospirillaceae bacterium]